MPETLQSAGRQRRQAKYAVLSLVPGLQGFIQLVVWFFSGLLFIRFLLALFGAIPANGLVLLITDMTDPLVAPLRYFYITEATAGMARFEVETLLSIMVFAITGLVLVWLLDTHQAGKRNI
ncbi:MAG: hypothetical protein WAQ57_01515 [Candidatus Saccharimonadales bacterium]